MKKTTCMIPIFKMINANGGNSSAYINCDITLNLILGIRSIYFNCHEIYFFSCFIIKYMYNLMLVL